MNYSELLNKGVVARFILLLTILILGFLQMRNAYANRLNEKACQMIDNKLAIENIDKAIELNKQNPLYYANLGLIYARMDSLISLESFYADKKINSEMLDNALKYYHIAESLKVNDPLFCLNITLLYALKGDSENAVHYIDKIAEYANDEWYYLFSAHIYKNIDKPKAKENYLQALLLSPGLLSSPFFVDQLFNDATYLTEEIREELEKRLRSVYTHTQDPVIMAKLAKVLLDTENRSEAETLFLEATKRLPSLNRPWCYLGYIAEQRRDTAQALLCYRKAEALSLTDAVMRLYKNRLEDRTDNLPDIDTRTKYRFSERNLVYRKFFSTSLLKDGMVINDFNEYQQLYGID